MPRSTLKEAALEPSIDLAHLQLAGDGAQLYRNALSVSEVDQLRALAEPLVAGQSGARIFGGAIAAIVAAPDGAFMRIAVEALGADAKPIRAVLFDKSEEVNWSAGWHQDRTIAVRERHEAEGYGPWSVKGGAIHVEPPFEILRDMITLRAHLDDCGADNAPLLVAPGSHRLGRVPIAAIDDAAARLGSICCLARAGDIWVYATPILHASDRAKQPRRRRVLQVDFSASPLANGLEWLGIESSR
jgi:hypothetical protein